MPQIGTVPYYLCRIKSDNEMLKCIYENLQVRDCVEIVTPDGTIDGGDTCQGFDLDGKPVDWEFEPKTII